MATESKIKKRNNVKNVREHKETWLKKVKNRQTSSVWPVQSFFSVCVFVCECVQGGNIMQKQQQQQKGYQKQQAALI